MSNEVTAFGIIKALKVSGGFCSARMVARLSNIDDSSENLQMIIDEMYDFKELGFLEVKVLKDPKAPWRKRPWFKIADMY